MTNARAKDKARSGLARFEEAITAQPKAARRAKLAAMQAVPSSLWLSSIEVSCLHALVAQRTAEVRLVERARIVLGAGEGLSDTDLHHALGCSRETARRWRQRYEQRRAEAPFAPVRELLEDEGRVGRPASLPDTLWVDLLSLVTTSPEQHGLPFTHWTSEEMARLAVDKGWTPHLSASYVREFLAESRLKPHQVKEWMNRPDDPEFDARATHIKDLLATASETPTPGHVVFSYDEKTGMQARERLAPSQPMQAGRVARQEFEYARHGTLVLFTFFIVATGAIQAQYGETRTSADTARVLEGRLAFALAAGATHIDVVLDQLNTHLSREMVAAVARVCGVPMPDKDVMSRGASRRAWLERTDRRVVFHFTPKHASWLNPVEIWFGVLVRRVLRRGSFCSKADLQAKVRAFVEYYNDKLAHRYDLRRYHWAA